MAWWVLVAILVATTVVMALLAPRPPNARPSALGEFQFPTAEEGRVIPVGFGTFKVAGPNVTWYGDLKTVPIKVRSGLFSKTTIGYEYWIGMQLSLCHGPVEFVGLTAGQAPDDITVPYTIMEQTADYVRILLDSPELFGGEKREGGLRGEVKLYLGTQNQGSDSYLSAKLGITAPEYHGLCYAVFKQVYVGTSNYPKPINFILRRRPSNLGLGAGVTQIGGNANPVEMIYDLMTDPNWGLGRASSRFDLTSWQTVATTLASEGMGMSMLLDREDEAQNLLEDIQRHIDGVTYTDPQTGLWTIALARADYDPEAILELTKDDLVQPPDISRGSWEETWNEVKVRYTDPTTFKVRTAQAQDSANQQVRGNTFGQTMDFLGFTNATLAQSIAMRELKAHSYPFAKGTFHATRKAWPLRVGSVFKVSWEPTGIASLVFRVLGIDYGELERGIIKIDAVEDAFAVAYAAFDPPEDTAWVDPLDPPEPPAAQILQESPFEWLPAPIAQERILVGAVRADWSSRGYEIHADEGPGYYQSNTSERFCPSGILTADYLRTTSALDATGFTLQNEKDLDVLVGTDAAGRVRGDCLLLFEDTGEICAFQTVTDNGDGTFTFANIVRGVFDTFPADHPEPDSITEGRVFIIRDAGTWYLVPYKADEAESIEGGGDQFIVEED